MSEKPGISGPNDSLIARLTADQLRKIADQLDAYGALINAGARRIPGDGVIEVDGDALAYLYWNGVSERYMAEWTNFTPGSSVPLIWHGE